MIAPPLQNAERLPAAGQGEVMSIHAKRLIVAAGCLLALSGLDFAQDFGRPMAMVVSSGRTPAFMDESLSSPRLADLKKDLEAGKPGAVAEFWKEIETRGAPLIESIKEDTGHLLVTFLWCDQKNTQVIVNNDFSKSVYQMTLVRLLNTDVWYKTFRMRDDARFFYQFSVDDPAFPFVTGETTRYPTKFQPDPLNPRRYDRLKPNIFSVVELPKAPSLELTVRQPDLPKGVVGQVQPDFKSTILGRERRIFIYRPPGFTKEGPAYPLIVVAATYVSTIPLPIVLDNLLAKGLLPPVVVIFDQPVGTQQSDSDCSLKYGDFLAKELVPAMRERLHATTDPRQTIVGGASMGGLAAACVASQHPEVFGNVLSQSGSYWWSPDNDLEDQWLTRQIAQRPRVPVDFYLSIGLLESEQAF
ncbi:MAG TPA: alpha/beta hydrolase-fold protein, partial [Pyrinomonadaceae bacterium]|nr:alpha/beta hydrolase-fold protein [Pyrinomonadaceae bacterium]